MIFMLQSVMQVLAKEEENYNGLEKDETRMDIDQASQKFLDVARQLEAFFLQKRFVLSVLKPELIMKEVSPFFVRISTVTTERWLEVFIPVK